MIIFRCNAGPEIGFGHLVRCRGLAEAFNKEGAGCIMVGPDETCRTEKDKHVFLEWQPRKSWISATEDAAWLAELARLNNANFLVLDDYRVNENYQLVLKNEGFHWLQFAQPNQNLWADLVLNSSPVANADDYGPYLRNPNTKLLLGLQYAILRSEFLLNKTRRTVRAVNNILITFGGGDDRGAIKFVLETLLPTTSEDIKFLVISGIHNPRNQELTRWIEEYGNHQVILKINPPDIPALFADCDLAIMAGGTTTYEVAFFGIPMLLISIAENQVLHSLAWEKIGAARYLGKLNDLSDKNLTNSFYKCLNQFIPFSDNFVDGCGGKRIARVIFSMVKS